MSGAVSALFLVVVTTPISLISSNTILQLNEPFQPQWSLYAGISFLTLTKSTKCACVMHPGRRTANISLHSIREGSL